MMQNPEGQAEGPSENPWFTDVLIKNDGGGVGWRAGLPYTF